MRETKLQKHQTQEKIKTKRENSFSQEEINQGVTQH